MKNFNTALLTATVATFVIAGSAFAAGSSTQCQPIYGGGQTCVQGGNIVIDKKVQKANSSEYTDNLGVNDPKFVPGQNINFQITITNTGGTAVSKVQVQDIFPAQVSFVSGAGNYNASTKTLSFDVLNLNPGESRTFYVTAKAEQLASNKSMECEIPNKAIAIVDGQIEDIARFCIQKQEVVAQVPATTKGGLKVFPPAQATTTPSTGPETLALFALIPSGLAGYILRKKSIR